MEQSCSSRSGVRWGALAIATFGLLAPRCASAYNHSWDNDNVQLNIAGYIRVWSGFLLQNQPDVEKSFNVLDPAQLRGTLLLDVDLKTGPVKWKFVGRLDEEYKTDYLQQLSHLNNLQSPGGPVGKGHDYLDQYNTTSISNAVREFYADYDLNERISFRVGKQQLVWGEGDFFHALDVIEGFDYRWRLFFEDNQDYRKPLSLVTSTIQVPEADGDVQIFVRPPIDQDDAIGSSFNLEGGRWIPQPYHGVDFLAFTKYNYHHPEGDKDIPTYGIRWKGTVGDFGYSLAYMNTFNPEPVINPPSRLTTSGLFGVTHSNPYKVEPENQVLGDFIYPKIDVFGATGNYYVGALDSTFSGELVLDAGKPYNYGQLQSSLPGWGGIIRKDTLISVLRVDKNLNFLQRLIGVDRPSLASLQVFDTWILNYKENEQIVEFASFAHQKQEHTTYLTAFLLANYVHDTINPSFVIGTDVGNGGGFIIPAVEYVIGDNWRLKAEADLFWITAQKSASATTPNGAHINPLGINEHATALFGYYSGDNQVVLRLTRQF